MIARVWIVAFSGHRSLANPGLVATAIRTALADLQARVAAQGGSLEFFGSIACGTKKRALILPGGSSETTGRPAGTSSPGRK